MTIGCFVAQSLYHPFLSRYDLNNVERDVKHQGPVVQSIVSLTSLLVVKMLTVLVSTILNS